MREKSKAYSAGVATQADDAKYKLKCKELKSKVAEIEEDNTKLHLKILKSKKNIHRLRIQRAILYDRLQSSATPSNPYKLSSKDVDGVAVPPPPPPTVAATAPVPVPVASTSSTQLPPPPQPQPQPPAPAPQPAPTTINPQAMQSLPSLPPPAQNGTPLAPTPPIHIPSQHPAFNTTHIPAPVPPPPPVAVAAGAGAMPPPPAPPATVLPTQVQLQADPMQIDRVA
ncbi:hypothetical protein T439DRAFT_377024 [Meredithblackwellia eburnea MCA 4105]